MRDSFIGSGRLMDYFSDSNRWPCGGRHLLVGLGWVDFSVHFDSCWYFSFIFYGGFGSTLIP